MNNLKESKVFGPSTVGAATLIGGALAGGFMLAHNFYILGEPSKAKSSIIFWSILAIIQFIVVIQPWHPILMTYLPIILLYPMLANFIIQKFQAQKIEQDFPEERQYDFIYSSKITLIAFLIMIPMALILKSIIWKNYQLNFAQV